MHFGVNKIAFAILLYQCLTICAGDDEEDENCAIPIPDRGDLDSPRPRSERAAVGPSFQFGYMHFKHEEPFSLVCDEEKTISIKLTEKNTNKITVTCLKDKSFLYDGLKYEYKEVKCHDIIITNTSVNASTENEDPYAVAVARHKAGLQDCSIILPDPDLNNQPIPFITNSTPAILHPNQYGFFTIKAKDEFKLTCADTQFVAPVAGVSEITVKCISTSYLEFENRQYQFDRFRCKHIPRPKVVITHQRCQSDEYKVTHVGFETKSAFLILYKLCFDPEKLVSTYGWYHVYSPQYKNRQITMVKPNYPKSQNYGKWDLDMLYWNQDLVLEKVFKSKKRVNELIIRENKQFVTKTHLIAKSEFYYSFERHATYLWENTVPQWYRPSKGYWRDVERVFRRYLSESKAHHVVVSGTYLTSALPDHNGVPHLFYLTLTRQLPVPQYLWKMNYNVDTDSGVVWIGINNPTSMLNETQFLCDPIECPARMKRKSYQRKLMYCCTKDAFEKVYGRLDPVVFGQFNVIKPQP